MRRGHGPGCQHGTCGGSASGRCALRARRPEADAPGRASAIRARLVVVLSLLAGSAGAIADDKVTYTDHVRPVFANRCLNCHNAEKHKGGLDLSTYGGALTGSSGGKIVNPGEADGSTLFGVVSHTREPKMPPSGTKIADAEIELIRKWIADGCLETRDSKPAVAAVAPALALNSSAQPAAERLLGVGLPLGPIVESERAGGVVALAMHPTSPLVALGGQKQVLVYNSDSAALVGVLSLDGDMPQSIRFSRDGRALIVGAGVGAKSGRVQVFDFLTGRRLATLGEEFDVVRAADLASRGDRLALGGTTKVVKVLSTRDGALIHKIEKHTDWITDVTYSPDGILLATADRAGALFVWEAASNALLYAMPTHPGAITSIDWRADSNLLASACEDGQVRLFEMGGGTQAKAWAAHPGGALSVRFGRDGRIVTAGRDKTAKLWGADGAAIKAYPALGDIVLAADLSFDVKRAVLADLAGVVRVVNADDGATLAELPPNPPSLAAQLATAQKRIDGLRGQRIQQDQGLAAAKQKVAEAEAALAAARQQADAAQQSIAATHAALVVQDAEQAKIQAGMLRIELDAARQQLAQLKSTEQAGATTAGVAQAAADQAAAALAAAKAQADAQPVRMQELASAVAAAQAALAAASTDRDAKAKVVEAKTGEVAAFVQSAERLKAQAAAAADNAALAEAATKAGEALALLEKDLAAARVAAEQAATVIGGKEAEFKAAQQAVELATVERDAFPARLEQLAHAAEAARQAAATAAAAVAAAHLPVESAEKQIAELDARYRQLVEAARSAYGS